MANQILIIAPYWVEEFGAWVFDDPQVGLAQEPFVSGVPEMIDYLVKDIPNARTGFRLLFSPAPFPGYQKRLKWRREEFGGNWYASDDPPMEGWLCPALFRYFDRAPTEIYVKAEAKKDISEEKMSKLSKGILSKGTILIGIYFLSGMLAFVTTPPDPIPFYISWILLGLLGIGFYIYLQRMKTKKVTNNFPKKT